MYIKTHSDSVARGLVHVGGNMSVLRTSTIDLLNAGEGSRDGCLGNLSSNSAAISTISYFRDHNIKAMKQWAYVSAKLRIMWHHMFTGEDYLVEELLWPLISDNEEVIDWYCQHNRPYLLGKKITGGDIDDPKNYQFYRYQSWLALNARWEELRQRSELILGMQDEIKKDRNYLIDHRFYLAIANGDKSGMEAVLEEMCQPKQRKARHDQESGVTHNFIASYATVFAKLAWRNGFEVEIDTPWIPKEWLPVTPLNKYEDPWPFMETFDIFKSFEGEAAPFSPVRR